jgi:hypothetical protein
MNSQLAKTQRIIISPANCDVRYIARTPSGVQIVCPYDETRCDRFRMESCPYRSEVIHESKDVSALVGGLDGETEI